MNESTKSSLSLIPDERIANKIYVIRGIKVMLDRDLAELYGVETKVLNQAVTRNKERFPEHFMFRLTKEEFGSLRSQIVTLEGRGKYPKYLPRVFTEQGVAMLSAVLKSKRAVQVSIQIMDTFTKLRQILASDVEMRKKVEEMDGHIESIYKLLAHLMVEEKKPKNPMGFGTE